MRRPLTTTSRRRGCACDRASLMRPQPTNATPAIAPAVPASSCLRVVIGELPGFMIRQITTSGALKCHLGDGTMQIVDDRTGARAYQAMVPMRDGTRLNTFVFLPGSGGPR